MDEGFFGPGSVSWRVHQETTVLFGGARALLMQAAHPLVLAGARQTGMYERNPWKRLERTLALQYTLTFGSRAEARAAAERINRVHREISGVDEVTGLRYDAMDPELLLWVHACLVDSSLLFEELTVGALTAQERERFHREQMLSVELLGLPRRRIPRTVGTLRRYIDRTIASGTVRVTDDSLAVARLIAEPPKGIPWRPVLRAVSRWAFATLPPELRRQYGVRWNPLRELELRSSLTALRLFRPIIPDRFRRIEPARQAERRTAAA